MSPGKVSEKQWWPPSALLKVSLSTHDTFGVSLLSTSALTVFFFIRLYANQLVIKSSHLIEWSKKVPLRGRPRQQES